MAQTDAELVEQARSGPGDSANAAFAELVGRHGDPLYRWIAARLRRPGDAEELAAEAFVRAWRSLATLERPEWFRPWLYQIARNLIRNWFSGKGMNDPRFTASLEAFDAMDSMAAVADQPDLRSDLRDAMASIPEPQRRALHLRFEMGMSYAEIAAAEGVSTDTVKERLSQGRARLERSLLRGGWMHRLGPGPGLKGAGGAGTHPSDAPAVDDGVLRLFLAYRAFEPWDGSDRGPL